MSGSLRIPAVRIAVLLALLPALLLAACAPIATPAAPEGSSAPAENATLAIFAAASLTNAFGEIGDAFAVENPGAKLVFNFAGSNQLATQIAEDAPADVFASANNTQMTVAIDTGRIVDGSQATFVNNRLVIVAPSDNPAGLESLADLATPGTLVVFAAAEAPVGQYSLDFLDKAAVDPALGEAYKAGVLANIVSNEANVRAVLTKVALGEADAGIVYTSDVASDASSVTQIEIPDALNTIASYPIAPLTDSANPELAQAFVDYVLSPAGQKILAAHGFIPAVQ